MKSLNSDLLLYAVTDRSRLQNSNLYNAVSQAIDGGVTFVQLREKCMEYDDFLKEALEIGALCRLRGIPFVINDNVRIALESGADGVHVGQSDIENLNVSEIRRLIGPEKILGVSAQTAAQALEAQRQGADYIGVGAVFPTDSKADAYSVSIGTLRDICSAVAIPVVAIGGIDLKNIKKLSGTGIRGVAVISAIFAQDDVKTAAEMLRVRADEVIR